MVATFLLTEYMVKFLAMMMIMSSTSNSHMTQMSPQNPNYGVEISTPFPYTALLNKSPWTQKALRTRSISWRDTFLTRRSIRKQPTTLRILMALVMWSGTSYLWFTDLVGTLYILTINPKHSGKRFCQSLLPELLPFRLKNPTS